MENAKRIFIISDFKDEHTKSIRMQPRMWVKGLQRAGCDVYRFSYRNMLLQSSIVPSKRFALNFARKKTNRILADELRHYHPDIVLAIGLKYINPQTMDIIREAAPRSVIVARDEDPNPEEYAERIAIARKSDVLIATSAGRFLQTYKNSGVPLCAFLPNICDPDIQKKWDVEKKWKADIIFTGKPEHTRLGRNSERYEIISRLRGISGAVLYGAFGTPRVEGMDYFYAISGAKIGLSINIANDVDLYHSDRFTNYISCGTCVLARRVPQTDKLFENKKHVRYFDTKEEFFELADWYLKHDDERERLAMSGMAHAHDEFNCTRMAKIFLELVDKGDYDAQWKAVL
ncbi:MAG: glycosyltransferase [Phycisphaerae bacterium]